MSNLSESEKSYEQSKKKLYQAEANFAYNLILKKAGIDDSGDYILALGSDNALFLHAEAAVFRIRKKLWGKKSYQIGLFAPGKDHDVLLDTQGMAPISSIPAGLGIKWNIYPCPGKCASEVREWVKIEVEDISSAAAD